MTALQSEPGNEKILIIGAGIGGLVTAQILRGFDIPFEIFERAEDMSGNQRGWAVGLIEY